MTLTVRMTEQIGALLQYSRALAAALAGSEQAAVANAIAGAVARYDFAGAREALRHLVRSLGHALDRPGVWDDPRP